MMTFKRNVNIVNYNDNTGLIALLIFVKLNAIDDV